MASEMDLCCSESSEDWPGTPRTHSSSVWLEFRLLDEDVALSELQRLFEVEVRSMVPTWYISATKHIALERATVVDAVMKAGEMLHFNATTSALAVNLLDRLLAVNVQTAPQHQLHSVQRRWVLMLNAVACLSIAGKLEEVARPPSTKDLLEAMDAAGYISREETSLGELAVLHQLEWRVVGVTALNALDPVISLLDLRHPSFAASGSFQNACSLREACKLVLVKSLRDAALLAYPPTLLALAAAVTVLQGSSQVFDVLAVISPVTERFCEAQIREVQHCCYRLRQFMEGVSLDTILRDCKVEVLEQENLVRVLPAAAVHCSPTSVLQPLEGARRDFASRETYY